MLNTDFKEVCKITENGFEFMGNEFKGKVIYTGPIDYKFGDLPYRSLKQQIKKQQQ